MIDILIYLSYFGSFVVAVSASVRAAALEGWQWYAYWGYTFNSFVLILYGLLSHQHHIVLNQGLLMVTNIVGLIRWKGK